MFKKSYYVLLALTILATLGGIITLLPRAAASYPNLMGYSSVCTYAPAATLFCFLIAGTLCFVRSTFIKDQSGTPGERFKRHGRSLIVLGVLLALALAFHIRYVNIKAYYTDTVTAATADK